MNPIKGSEIYQDDGAVKALIEELKQLRNEYSQMVSAIQSEAAKLKRSINSTNNAQSATTKVQEENAKQAEKLSRQYIRYQQSLTDVGKEQIRLRQLQRQRNQLVKAEVRFNNSAIGSYDRLSAQYSINKIKLNAMSKEQRATTKAGKQLEKQTENIYNEMKRLQEATGKAVLSVGDYKTSIKAAFSDIATGALGPAAIGAAIASGAIAAGQYVGDATEKIRKLRGEVQTLTGETGSDLDKFTARISAIGKTFEKDEQVILEAANSVANQLNISFDDALSKIEEGFIAGSNITDEFLDSLKEYPTFFAEAGLGADDLFQVLNQSVKEGIYSDKGVDAIKEATIRLREQPQAAIDALQAIGLSSKEIGKTIESDGIGAAIAMVSKRLGELEASSPEVGKAIAGIFGGAGEDAGLSFLTTLESLGGETSNLIDINNEYQQQQKRLLEANQSLSKAQTDLLNIMGGTGASFQVLKAEGESLLFRALKPLFQAVQILWQSTEPLRDSVFDLYKRFGFASEGGTLLEGVLNSIVFVARVVAVPITIVSRVIGFLYNRIADLVDVGRDFLKWLGVLGEKQNDTSKSTKDLSAENAKLGQEIDSLREKEKKLTEEKAKSTSSTNKLTSATREFGNATKKTSKEVENFADGSLAKARKAVSDLRKELSQAGEGDQLSILRQLIGAESDLKELESYLEGIQERLINKPLEVVPELKIKAPNEVSIDGDVPSAVQGILDEFKFESPEEKSQSRDLFDLLGFDVSDKKKQAIGSAFEFAKGQVLQFAQIRTELAKQEVQRTNEEVGSAESALQAELTRNEQGLASNVEARRRDLEDAKKNQKKAQNELKKSQRDERRLQNIQQTANLVTASAKIWSQLGFPAAIPAIGIMFGSFLATKVRAAKLARQQNRRGTYQVLRQGSSHESGDDIYVGTDARGVEHTAERGEGFAVIPSASVSKYSKVLPGLMKAIRGGRLGQWVERQSASHESALKVVHGPSVHNSDNTVMENGIDQIAKNTSKRVYTDSQGRTVIEEGLNRTIIRA